MYYINFDFGKNPFLPARKEVKVTAPQIIFTEAPADNICILAQVDSLGRVSSVVKLVNIGGCSEGKEQEKS